MRKVHTSTYKRPWRDSEACPPLATCVPSADRFGCREPLPCAAACLRISVSPRSQAGRTSERTMRA
eukprot:4656037-Prymnesium_polylepis.1